MTATTTISLPEAGYIRAPAVRALLGGISDPTLWRWTRAGRCPAPIRLGPNTVAWSVEELRVFLADPQGWAATHAKAAA